MLQSGTDSSSAAFPKQQDIAQVCVYGLSILSAGLFLFLPFVNLLHPSPRQRWMGIPGVERQARKSQNDIFLDVCLADCRHRHVLAPPIPLFATNVKKSVMG